MSDEAILDTCGCCKGTEPLTPASLENPHGLSAIAYRIGTHATFKETMLAGLSRQRKLDRLTTRESDDPSIALVDAAATVLDVLTFYQERIANEGYLRTASERRSILELARSIGYELSPGVAASTYLAFELETAPGSPERVLIDMGTKVQSLPGPGEQPQTFETIEKIEARPKWNTLKPQQTRLRYPKSGDVFLYLQGTTTNLKPGDPILIVGEERVGDPGSERWEFRRIVEVEAHAEKGWTRVRLHEPLGSRLPPVVPPAIGPTAHALRLRAALFGHNAPDFVTMPESVKRSHLGLPEGTPLDTSIREWPDFTIAAISDPPTETTTGTGLYAEYFDEKDLTKRRLTRTDPTVNFTWGTGSPDPTIGSDTFSVRWTGWIQAKNSGSYIFSTLSDDGVRLWVDGKLLINNWTPHPPTKNSSGPIQLEAGRKYDIKLEYYEQGGNAVIQLSWQPPGGVEAIIPQGQLYPRDIHSLHLDALYPQILPRSWIVLAVPEYVELYRVKEVAEDSRTRFTLTAKTSKIIVQGEGLRERFSEKLRETILYGQSKELPLAETPLLEDFSLTSGVALDLENGTLTPLGGDRIVLDRLVEGLQKGQTLIVSGKLIRAQVNIDGLQLVSPDGLTQDLTRGETLQVLKSPVLEGSEVSWHLEDAEGFEGFIKAARTAFTLVSAAKDDPAVSEVVFMENPPTSEEKARTVLELTDALAYVYDRATVRIHANVAKATHGETRREVLGSGQAGQPFQRFTLKQKPLTYISAPTPSGRESTLEVRVNDIRWDEILSLYARGSKEPIYIARLADDGTVSVQFGDGATGARLPTGAENVVATYRVGTGLAGLVKANQLSLLMTRPLGVKGVANPLAPTGAADPEPRDQARRNAPFTVLTLDRIVSLKDYQDFARAFAGIGKAQAVELRRGEIRLVHVTVAAADGGKVDPTSDLYKNLKAAIAAQSDEHQLFVLESYTQLQFNVEAKLRINPRYLPEKVLPAVRQGLLQAFSFEARSFGQPVTGSEVIAVMQRVEGVVSVDLDFLYFAKQPKLPPPDLPLKAKIARWNGGKTQPAELLTLNPSGIELSEVKP